MGLSPTAAELAGGVHQRRLDDQRVRHQAFVHDGVAQLLRAVATGGLDRQRLWAWTEQEIDRLDADGGGTEVRVTLVSR